MIRLDGEAGVLEALVDADGMERAHARAANTTPPAQDLGRNLFALNRSVVTPADQGALSISCGPPSPTGELGIRCRIRTRRAIARRPRRRTKRKTPERATAESTSMTIAQHQQQAEHLLRDAGILPGRHRRQRGAGDAPSPTPCSRAACAASS